MKKQLFTAAILSTLMLAGPVLADDSTSTKTETTYTPASNGGYESKYTIEHTDANGTTVTHQADKKVDIDSKGNKETKVDIKNTTDPKGLMNKSTTEIQNKAVEKDGKSEYSHKKTVDGDVVEKTDQEKQAQ